MTRFAALLGVLLLAACSSLPGSGALYDGGGRIVEYEARLAALKRSGEPFAVPVVCMSACTIYLDHAGSCFSPRGVLGFHSASAPVGVDLWNRRLASHYPAPVARWFLAGPARSSAIVRVRVQDFPERFGVSLPLCE